MKAVNVFTIPLANPGERQASPIELALLNDGDRIVATEVEGGYVTLVVVSRKVQAAFGPDGSLVPDGRGDDADEEGEIF